jgi:secreted trypsin-like serine protease
MILPRLVQGAALSLAELRTLPYAAIGLARTNAHNYVSETLPHFCGSTFVAPDIIVSAAHCLDTLTPNIASWGFTDYDTYRSGDVRIVGIDQWVVHPEYDPSSFYADIAVAKLAHPAADAGRHSIADIVHDIGSVDFGFR